MKQTVHAVRTKGDRNATGCLRAAFAPVKPREPDDPKSAVARLFDQNGGVKRVQVKLGLGPAQCYAFTDPRETADLGVARAAALTDSEAPAMAEYFALLANGVFLPIAVPDKQTAELTADVAREYGEAIAKVIVVLPDGIDPDQARDALKEIDEALRAIVQLRVSVAAYATNNDDERAGATHGQWRGPIGSSG